MAIKTQDQINSEIIALIQALRTDVDVSVGNLIQDVVANSPSTAIALVYTLLQNISYGQSIQFISQLSDDQVDILAYPWGLTRKTATQATGYVTFFRRTDPASTITINSGTTITSQKSAGGVTYSFITTETASISSSSYNTLTGLWESTVAIQAVLAGTDSNVATNVITVANGISGIDGCTNRLALTNGTDDETNEQLATRIVSAAQARLLGTAPGYESLVNAISGVLSSKVITPGDPDSSRNANGNEVDIIVMGSVLDTSSQVEIFSGANGICVTLDNLPVDVIANVQGACFIYTEGVDYQFVPDTWSEESGSTYAQDKIIWLTGGSKPSEGESYTIEYSYNGLITTVQDTVDDTLNHLIASDILIREADAVLIDMSLSVSVTAGSPTDAVDQIKTGIADFMATLTMGDPVQQSDIDFYLRTQYVWIDRIILPFNNLARRGSTGQTDLTFSKYEYATIDDTSLTITLV